MSFHPTYQSSHTPVSSSTIATSSLSNSLSTSAILPNSSSLSTFLSNPTPATIPDHLPNSLPIPLPNPIPTPLLVATLNFHPMQTRSKSGITKPTSKLRYKATIDYTYAEPPSYKIAAKYPMWCEAMNAKFQAL